MKTNDEPKVAFAALVIPLVLAAAACAEEGKGSIELRIREPLGVDRPKCPVTMGVPFPEGALRSADHLRVEAREEALPLQTRTMLTWPDGSPRWVLLDFQRDLDAGEDARCTLFFGSGVKAGPAAQRTVSVRKTEAGVEVSTGPLSFTAAKGAALPLESASLNGRAILPAGAVRSTMKIDGLSYELRATGTPIVEEPGPLRAVVKVQGKGVAEDGKTSFDVTVRLYAYAGHPTLRIYLTLTNRIPEPVVPLEGCHLLLKPALDKTTTGFIVSSSQTAHNKTYVDELVNGKRSLRVPVYETGLPSEKEKVKRATATYVIIPGDEGKGESTRPGPDWHTLVPAAGVLGDGTANALLACRRPWHNAPKEMTVTSDAIRLALYPDWAEPLKWFRGVAKTHEILLDLRLGKLDQQERSLFAFGNESRPWPQVETRNWMIDSGAFGAVFRYQPEKYPWWEFVFRNPLKGLTFSPEGDRNYGATILNYGDKWTPVRGGQWWNNEMDEGFGLILQMIRSGNPRIMKEIEPIIHHMIDVDTVHDAGRKWRIGGQRYHSAWHGALCAPPLCHQWLEGPLFFYLLTGYQRAEEIALARADHFCRAIDSGFHRQKGLPRAQGWPMIALSRMYDCYRDERYVRACEKLIDWLETWYEQDGGFVSQTHTPAGGRKRVASPPMYGIVCTALMRYHRVTGNKRAMGLLQTAADDVCKPGMVTPAGFFLKTNSMFRDYYCLLPNFLFEPLAYVTQETGDKRYARIAYLNLQRVFIQGKRMTSTTMARAGYRYWLPALALFDELGMLRDPKPW